MTLSAKPLWLVGFRPFFILACAAGAVLPMLWALIFSGGLAPPAGRFSPVQWHAHEMFFGFGWAVLGGFLLTATKNWVQVRGYHGTALVGLALAWCVERIGMAWGGGWPTALFWASNLVFLGSIVVMLLVTLLRYRRQDSFADNYFFLLVLPAFLAAKLLLLSDAYFSTGASMSLGLFRMAFLVMLERTLTQFMKGVFQVDILRRPRLDLAIKLSAATLVFQAWMPPALALALLVILAALLLYRFAWWRPDLGLRSSDSRQPGLSNCGPSARRGPMPAGVPALPASRSIARGAAANGQSPGAGLKPAVPALLPLKVVLLKVAVP